MKKVDKESAKYSGVYCLLDTRAGMQIIQKGVGVANFNCSRVLSQLSRNVRFYG